MKFANAVALPAVRTPDDGDDPPPPVFTPSLDFSDARNSQYVALLFEDF